eukprot:TRINITY_DN29618_c0_g1_i1.p1 TRINITY_DN29618_c0_g1~~TRINITY_DN29618_c0_g1_i1.p1  ORF type:complete len:143 (-),score=12.84 TRINITY_DN29618_c0_g1_i1:244-672(-)
MATSADSRSSRRSSGRVAMRSKNSALPAVLLCALAALAMTTVSHPSIVKFPGSDKVGNAVERCGGPRTLAGTAAVGAVAGTILTAPLPLANELGAPVGAVMSMYFAQLPKDNSRAGRAGEFCRDVGKSATAFWRVLREEMSK